jgi:LacI family transcriptional regulator
MNPFWTVAVPEQRTPIHAPTMSDVARRARVSRATVSRVLNRYPHVRSEVRARVERAMAALAYRPDAVARSLARRETRTLGLVVTDITNPFYAETAAAIVKAARTHGYTVILCDTDNIPELQSEYIEVLRQRRVDGIILGSVFLRDPAVERLIDSGMPCMLYNRRLRSGRGNYVVLDNLRAGRELTRHLLGLGHRRIGFIGTLAGLSSAAERRRGYGAALREAGVRPQPQFVRMRGVKPELAREAAREILTLPDRPTAIVGSSDRVALSVIEIAEEMGLSVPGDLAVVGVDNIPMAAHQAIQLTTVDQHLAEMGRLAVEGILDIIRDPERYRRRPLQQVLAPTLIVRRTCGALDPPAALRGPRLRSPAVHKGDSRG